jgi:hypothetical protein
MLEARETSMTPLRLRMTEDMTLAGLAAGTKGLSLGKRIGRKESGGWQERNERTRNLA